MKTEEKYIQENANIDLEEKLLEWEKYNKQP